MPKADSLVSRAVLFCTYESIIVDIVSNKTPLNYTMILCALAHIIFQKSHAHYTLICSKDFFPQMTSPPVVMPARPRHSRLFS